jgi:TM2 domain-containing membrane protein YozV/RNA polymerase subunit RPABC4/transcription elongation factor Spt4
MTDEKPESQEESDVDSDKDESNNRKQPSENQKYCKKCGEIIHEDAEICPECGVRQKERDTQSVNVNVENQNQNIQNQGVNDLTSNKSKFIAAILAIFLGGFGVHKLYLGQPGRAILFFIFSWTLIPAIIAFIQGIAYLLMSEQKFARKFG